jgi:hypothetical protein
MEIGRFRVLFASVKAAMGHFLDRAMTTPESDSATAARGDRMRGWRSLVWTAAILLSLTVLGVAVTWPRARMDPQLLWNEAHNALQSGNLAKAEAKLASIRRLRAPTSFDWSVSAQIAVANERPEEPLSASCVAMSRLRSVISRTH